MVRVYDTGDEHFRLGARVVGRVRGLFGDGHVAGLCHELGELAVGDAHGEQVEFAVVELVPR